MPGFMEAFVASDRAGREQIIRQFQSRVNAMSTVGQLDTMRERLKLEQDAAPSQNRLRRAQAEAYEVDTTGKKTELLQAKETRDAVAKAVQQIDVFRRLYGGGAEGKPRDIPPEALVEIGNILKGVLGGEEALATIEAGVPAKEAGATAAGATQRRVQAEADTELIPSEKTLRQQQIKLEGAELLAMFKESAPLAKVKALTAKYKFEAAEAKTLQSLAELRFEEGWAEEKVAEELDLLTGKWQLKKIKAEVDLLLAKTKGEDPAAKAPDREFYLSQLRMLEVAISRIEMAATGSDFMASIQDDKAFAKEGGDALLRAFGSMLGQQSFTTAADKAAAREKLEAFRSVLIGQAREDVPDVDWGDVRPGTISSQELQDGITDFRSTK